MEKIITCPACKGLKKIMGLGMMGVKNCTSCDGIGSIKIEEDLKPIQDLEVKEAVIIEERPPVITTDPKKRGRKPKTME